MGGKILEFSADKYYDAGKEEGRTEGRTEGEQRLASLVKALMGRGDGSRVPPMIYPLEFPRCLVYNDYREGTDAAVDEAARKGINTPYDSAFKRIVRQSRKGGSQYVRRFS